jgi:diguanylate cyclase (GGDEF)-like protein
LRPHELRTFEGAGDRGRRPAPRWALGRIAIALIIVWLGVMGLAGWALVASQNHSRSQMSARAESRTKYAASFISIYARDLLARDRSVAVNLLGAPSVAPEQLQRVASGLGLSDRGLLDSRANVSPVGDIALVEFDGAPAVHVAVSYQTFSGTRALSGIYPIGQTVLLAVMKHVLTTSGSQTELVDLRGGSLVTGGSAVPGGQDAVFAAPVAGTEWQLIVRTPESQLYGLINGPGRWLAWVALAGLAVAGLAVIVLIARLARQRTQLTILNAQLARLAAVDPLTGLRNRRAIEQYLHDALSSARRHDLDLSVLVIDVDHFKSFNDMLGHRSGDAALVHTARVLDRALRAEDAIGRWGGEEFLVVLPGTDEEGALRATERLRADLLADQPEEARIHALPVTVTIGLAQWQDEAMDELVSRADRALYLGKASGRDTVQVAPTAAAL